MILFCRELIQIKSVQVFFEQNEWLLKIIFALITIIIAALVYKIILHATEKAIETDKAFNGKKSNTYIKLFRSIIRYIFVAIVIIVLLKIFGVNVSSMLAGLGLIGVILGLAVQDLIKDVIRGSSILSDDYFSVGDVIKYKDVEGQVLVIGLKTTKIRELTTNNVISIANRNIEEAAVLSNNIFVRVPLPYELKLEEQRRVVGEIVETVKQDELIEDCANIGLAELADSKIEYLLKITLDPLNKLQARRNTLERILETLEKNGIEVPYNQIDVHQK